MYVFSRRSIQGCLDGLDGALTVDQRRTLANRLNKPDRQRIATVWETVLLSALNRIGEVTYEPRLASGQAPDIAFAYRGVDEQIFAEVTSVSDAGLDEDNPFAKFWDDLEAAAVRIGVLPSGLNFQVGHSKEGHPANPKIKLRLPKRADVPSVLQSRVVPFLNEIHRKGLDRHALKIDESGISISITYDRTQ